MNKIFRDIMKKLDMKPKFIRYTLLLIWWIFAGGSSVFAQQTTYKVGDVYTFVDGSKGVVCYVNPDDPRQGWVMDIRDVPARMTSLNTAGTFVMSTGAMDLPTWTIEPHSYTLSSWIPEGESNTHILYESHISPAMQNQYIQSYYYNHWYIPDIMQLRIMYSIQPDVKSALTENGGYEMDERNSVLYWSSTALNKNKLYTMYSNSGQVPTDGTAANTGNCRIRLVREFNVGQAYAYWIEDLPNISNSMTVMPTQDTTYFHANVVYGDTTFQDFITAVYRHPVYRYQQGDNRPIIYDTTCQSTKKYTSKKNSNFTNLDVSRVGEYNAQVTLGTKFYGCDSIIKLHYKVNPVYDQHDTVVVCEDELPFKWGRNDKNYYETTTEKVTFKTKNGCNCDSSWTLHLKVVPMPEIYISPDPLETCYGVPLDITASVLNCPDAINPILYNESFSKSGNTNTMISGVNNNKIVDDISKKSDYFASSNHAWSVVGGGAIRFGVNAYNSSTGTVDEDKYGKVQTKELDLSEHPFSVTLGLKGWGRDADPMMTRLVISVDNVTDSVTIPGYVNGSNDEDAQFHDYVFHFQPATSHSVIKIEAINELQYEGGEDDYAESRFYLNRFLIQRDEPCTYEWFDANNQFIGNTETITVNNPTVNTTYQVAATNFNGCTSIQNVPLAVYEPTYGVDVQRACGSYTWINGITYTASTTPQYPQTFVLKGQNSHGCDSTVTLQLTIQSTIVDRDVKTACDSYVWRDSVYVSNGTTYRRNILPTDTFKTVDNCDSVVRREVTVYPSVHNSSSVSVCDNYVWHGDELEESGDYVYAYDYQYPNQGPACPSADTLHLTVNKGKTYEFDAESCESYTWNDETYTESGDYEQSFQCVSGCDSTVTLHLTVNHKSYGDTTVVACESFTWHGETYYETPSEDPTFTMVGGNHNGCDSIVTLHLTVNPLPEVTVIAAQTDPICPNGSIEIRGTTTATTVPYTYTWSGGGMALSNIEHTWNKVNDTTVATAPNVCNGTFTVTLTVRDANKCSNSNSTTVTVQQTETPTISTNLVNNTDKGCNWNKADAPTAADFIVTDQCNTNAVATVTPGAESHTGCAYTQTWTATYTNDCEMTAAPVSITYTWTVDTEKPVIATTAVSEDKGCNPTIVAPTFTGTDNCEGDISANINVVEGAVVENGCSRSQTWTANYTDGCNNAADEVSITYTWTVDTEKPVIATTAVSEDKGCNPTIVAPTFTGTDNCEGDISDDITVVEGLVVENGCSRSQTWTANYTDGCNNAADEVSITYTWTEDTQGPVAENDYITANTIPCIPDTTEAVSTYEDLLALGFVFSDGCGSTISFDGVVSNNYSGTRCEGSRTTVYRVKDNCGNTTQVTYVQPVLDNEAPVIGGTLPELTATGCNSSVKPAATDNIQDLITWGLTIEDNCSSLQEMNVTSIDKVTDSACVITVKRTYTVTDACNKSADVIQYIKIHRSDDFTIVADKTDSTVNCETKANVEGVKLPVVTDACGVRLWVPVDTVMTESITDCEGWRKFTFKYKNCDDSATTWTFTYHIAVPPLTAPAIKRDTIACLADTANRPYEIPQIKNTCNDEAQIFEVTRVSTVDNITNKGAITHTYRYALCADTVQWQHVYELIPGKFTKIDDSVKHVVCLKDVKTPSTPQFVVCGDPVSVEYDSTHYATASCDTSIFYYHYFVNGDKYVWKYSYIITPEEFSVPANVDTLVMCIADVKRPTPPEVKNSCDSVIVPVLNNVDSSFVDCEGLVVYTFNYNDCTEDHEKTWTYTYHVNDTVKPLIVNNLESISVAGCNLSALPEAATDVAALESMGLNISDNCTSDDKIIVSSNDEAESNACVITVTRTYTVKDLCNNAVTTQQIIEIHRVDTFTISSVKKDSTVNCEAHANLKGIILPVVKDACGVTLTPKDTTVVSNIVDCGGTVKYTFGYENCEHKDTSWTFTYTVKLPNVIANMPANDSTTKPCLVDVVRPTAPNILDACGNTIVPVFKDSTGVMNGNGTGRVVFRFQYTDCANHDSIWTYIYKINPDSYDPEDNKDTTVYCVTDIHTPTLPVITVCGTPVILSEGTNTSTLSGGCGDSTYVYTYRVNGTDYEWKYTYHVVPKAFDVSESVTAHVQCISDVVRPTPPAVVNSCGAPIVPVLTKIDSTEHGCADTVKYTFTYNDCTLDHEKTWTYTYYVKDTLKPAFTVPMDQTICRGLDDTYVATPAAMGEPTALSDNCRATEDLTATYTDVTTSYITKQDTITRTWKVSDGCNDSIMVQRIFINPVKRVNLEDEICADSIYESFGFHFVAHADTTVSDTTASLVTGCDSVTTVNIKVYHQTFNSITIAVNQSQLPYTLNDSIYYAAGTYIQHLPNSHNCDSMLTVTLLITDVYNAEDSTVCVTDLPLVWNDSIFHAAGTKVTTLKTPTGADSILTMNLYVRQLVNINLSQLSYCPTQGAVDLQAQFSGVVDNHSKVTWSFYGETEIHTDEVVPNNLTDQFNVLIPSNLCDSLIPYFVTYQDTYCEVSDTDYVHVLDTVKPLINGTLIELTAQGCNTSVKPAPYTTVSELTANGLTITDNCTVPTALVVSSSDAVTDSACVITVTRTYTVTDLCGNQSTAPQTIKIHRAADFTIANVRKADTVECESMATVEAITLPEVKDACNVTLIPTDTIVTDNITNCEGTRVFTFKYKNCEDKDTVWKYTYTIDVPALVVPPVKRDTISCLVDTNSRPYSVPVISNVCGGVAQVFSVTRTSTVGTDNKGQITHTYRYAVCADTVEWKHVYEVIPGTFTPIEDSLKQVLCVKDVHAPVTPTFTVCGETVNVSYDSVHAAKTSCDTAVYYYHYIVNGTTYVWKYKYVVSPAPFTVPTSVYDTVQCIAGVVVPTPPTVTNSCDSVIAAALTAKDSVFNGCEGHVAYTFTYNDCTEGHAMTWTYTYIVKDTVKPVITGTLPELTAMGCNSSVVPAAKTAIGDLTSWGLTITDNCAAADKLTLSSQDVVTDSACVITVKRTYTVTDLCGNQSKVPQTIKIHRAANFTIANVRKADTVECESMATVEGITLPEVKDACNVTLIPTDTIVTDNITDCEGTRVFTFKYKNCEDKDTVWKYTYTIDVPALVAPPVKRDTIMCLVDTTTRPYNVPVVTNACGSPVTTSLISRVSTVGTDNKGQIIHTYRYVACADTVEWQHVYEVIPGNFTPIEDSVKNVVCVKEVKLPVAPELTVCGETVNVSYDSVHAAKTSCDTAVYFYHYIVNGTTYVWKYKYVVTPAPFSVPTSVYDTVQCIAGVSVPTPPTVTNSCDSVIAAALTAKDSVFNGCEGHVAYTFTYNDCTEGHAMTWTYTYIVKDTVKPVITGTLPELTAMGCNSSVVPAAKTAIGDLTSWGLTITDNCAATDKLTLSSQDAVTDSACVITVKRTYTVTDLCGNQSTVPQTIKIHRAADFTIAEAETSKVVTCESMATVEQITLPEVKDACNVTLIPTDTIVTENITNCEGTRVFTFKYKSCEDKDTVWKYTYTIDVPALVAPEDDIDTIACIVDTIHHAYTPPVIVNACGQTAQIISHTHTSTVGLDNKGQIIHTYRYAVCGDTVVWKHICEVIPGNFSPLADSVKYVYCLSDVNDPTIPTLLVCGENVEIEYDSTHNATSPCDTVIYYHHYTVNAVTYIWKYSYIISPKDFTMPDDSVAYVQCMSDLNPVAPEVRNQCGEIIQPELQNPQITFNGCEGTAVYTYTYADCAGHTHDWKLTYHIQDTVAPRFTVPVNQQICRNPDSTYEAPTSAMGVPTLLWDNCIDPDKLIVTYTETVTNHITTQDTLKRVWTVSDSCQNKTELTQLIMINPILRDTVVKDTVFLDEPYTMTVAGHDFYITGPGVMSLRDTSTSVLTCDSITYIVVRVRQLCEIVMKVDTLVNLTCGHDGSISVSLPNGYEPIRYSIDDGENWQDSGVFKHLDAGTYRIMAVDKHNCPVDTLLTLVSPGIPVVTIDCPGDYYDTLAYGDCVMDIYPSQFGTPRVVHSLDWPMEISNDIPEEDLVQFSEGEHEVKWVAVDQCGVSDTCVQRVIVVFPKCPDAVDYEGNVYHGIRIDCECWTQRNLESTIYSNPVRRRGVDSIPCAMVYNSRQHPDEGLNLRTYGRLYCYDAVIRDSVINQYGHIQGICPNGWYVPSPNQYNQLNSHGASALRSPDFWLDGGGDNTTTFTALPAGFYNGYRSRFQGLRTETYFWATEFVTNHIYVNGHEEEESHIHTTVIQVDETDCDHVIDGDELKGSAYSVRCIKEKEPHNW